MDYIPHLSLLISVVLSIIAFFIKRELDAKDKSLESLEERVHDIEVKVAAQDVAQEKLSGRIDTVIEILERLEKKLETL